MERLPDDVAPITCTALSLRSTASFADIATLDPLTTYFISETLISSPSPTRTILIPKPLISRCEKFKIVSNNLPHCFLQLSMI